MGVYSNLPVTFKSEDGGVDLSLRKSKLKQRAVYELLITPRA